jgi:hypothetical protein
MVVEETATCADVNISLIRDTLNFIATVFALSSIVGLAFVVFFLFQGERRTAEQASERVANKE